MVELMSRFNHISFSNQKGPFGQANNGNKEYSIYLDYDKQNKKPKNWSLNRLSCLIWFINKCPGETLADTIDRKCRLIFPLAFIIFNIIYWSTYLL